MRHRLLGAGLLLLLLLALSGCGSREKGKDTVATVDGRPITSTEMNARVEQLKAYYRAQGVDVDTTAHQQVLEDLQKQALDSLIQMRMLDKAFKQEGIKVEDKAVQEQLAAMRSGMPEGQFDRLLSEQKMSEQDFLQQLRYDMQRRALYEKVTAGVQATEEEVQEYFQNHQEDLARYRLRYILAGVQADSGQAGRDAALAKSKETIGLLQKGEDFATLAGRRSDDPGTRENGGLAPWQSLQDPTMEAAVLHAAAALAVGEYTSQPVEGSAGYYVVLLEEKQDSLDQLRQEARDGLLRDKQNQAFGEYFDRLKASTPVERKQATAQ